MLRMVY